MKARAHYLRTVQPSSGSDITSVRQTILWHEAHAAAEETLQGGVLAPAWLTLFRNHLSTYEPYLLRWAGDMAESAEIRRAYSAIYGRYFARAILADHIGLVNFIPLRRYTTQLLGGYKVERTASGDIPDWIAWDPARNEYVFCEAKGKITGQTREFLSGANPGSVRNGKSQIGRVVLKDQNDNPVQTRGWVVATKWSTDRRQIEPISLVWDPHSGGRNLTDDEKKDGFDYMRRRWISSLVTRLQHPELFQVRRRDPDLQQQFLSIRAPASSNVSVEQMPYDKIRYDAKPLPPRAMSQNDHTDEYFSAIVSRTGIRPLRGRGLLDAALSEQQEAIRNGEPRFLVGLSKRMATYTSATPLEYWLSDCGISGPNGLGVFDIRKIELGV